MTANSAVVVGPKMIESRKFQAKECFAVTCLQPWNTCTSEQKGLPFVGQVSKKQTNLTKTA